MTRKRIRSLAYQDQVEIEPILHRPDLQTSGKDPYPLRDDEGLVIPVIEAVDCKPWKKCCEECAMRDGFQKAVYLKLTSQTDTHFYCVHRRDGEEHRVCAGFAALIKGRDGNAA